MFNIVPGYVKVLAALAVLLGACWFVYNKGYSEAELKGKLEIAKIVNESQKKLAEAEKKNAEISNRTAVEYITKTNTIREKEIVYRDAAATLVPQYNMSNGWIELHDAAAKLANPDAQLASDTAPSGVMDNAALAVVISNYAICKENSEQLKSLQKWITENRAANPEKPK